jgi:argininosuccinate lyase
MVPGIKPIPEAMRRAALEGHATATDLADYLVRKGLAFRDAHEVVARAVRFADDKGTDIAQLTLTELRGFSQRIDKDVFRFLTLEGSMAARKHAGGTAPVQVLAAAQRVLRSGKPRANKLKSASTSR